MLVFNGGKVLTSLAKVNPLSVLPVVRFPASAEANEPTGLRSVEWFAYARPPDK